MGDVRVLITHDGSMYAIYGNIYHQYTPFMLAYIPAPWIRHGLYSERNRPKNRLAPNHFADEVLTVAFKLGPTQSNWPTVWVNYNELTTSSLEIMVSKGNHPQMALIQVSELL